MSEQSSQRVNSNARGPKGGSLHTTPSLQSLGEVVSPLLRVPREIRNEIYKYLLYFPLPPLPGPVPVREWDEIRRLERRPSQFEDPNRNIDILRVNKQIHAEATEFLYSVNVFLIQITTSVAQEDINGHGLSSGDPTVLYDSPWETLGYFHGDKKFGRFVPYSYWTFQNCPLRLKTYSYAPRDVCWCTKCVENIKDQNLFPIPALRYRHLIRRIRIDLFEMGMAMKQKKQYNQDIARKLLLPFRYRLEEALKPVAESVAVEIIVASLDSKGSEEFQIETPKAYAELIETLWPLTAGPWKYTITLPVSIQQQYGYLTDSILESCNREVVVTKGEENHFLKVDIDHSRYLRVRNRGIYVLDHANYFPRYAESEPYTMHICRRPSKGKLTSKVTEPTSSSPTSSAPGPENASKRSSRLWGSIAQGTRRVGDKIRQRVS
ncbi:hypothetical protein TWF225_004383 [Orbilia oligospora]|nr:hypothetical protein TWF225_004383 [Orbilia oligospora]KAF3260027.1 hypothetical protein TWF217_005052 [Orbilia oligospora]KAF3267108.1 hypothetical protein TWF128_010063 [Orbilia oligospora]